MTAMTLDSLSGGRFILGIGPSGPQVVEGWHGVSYGKPLQRTREYIEIVRKIPAREVPVEHHGKEFDILYTGPGASGLGKPLKSILHGRKDMPIYTASISPKGIALAAEIADGVIPVWMNPERWDIYDAPLKDGFAKTGEQQRAWPISTSRRSSPASWAQDPRGMPDAGEGDAGAIHRRDGRAGQEFLQRLRQAARLRRCRGENPDLYLAGKKAEAMAMVPNKLVDEVALVGNRERIADRLKAWRRRPSRRC